MTSAQYEVLRRECNVAGPREGACQFLCGTSLLTENPWAANQDDESELRLTIHRVDPIPPDRVRADERAVSWDMNCYIQLLRKSREELLHPGICHSHPGTGAPFSQQDDENEGHLRDVLFRRNRNPKQFLISVLFRGEKWVDARVWGETGRPRLLCVRIVGQEMIDANAPIDVGEQSTDPGFLQRQSLAVGSATVKRLQKMRVGVVGCGGTGSAVVGLLARSGVGKLLLVDPDVVEETNLNRLHGSTRKDVDRNRTKVRVLKDYVENMGLGTHVTTRQTTLSDAATAMLLRGCDIVFGCTDDHLGRLILNRLAYFYLIPVIDTGLSVNPSRPGKPAQVSGRVTVLRPQTTCLLCRKVVNPRRAREQGLRYKHPEEYARQVKEGYITDSTTPTPVVGTFTTETATAAVNEFLAGVAGLRGHRGWAAERTIRYDLDRCRPTGCSPKENCPVCGDDENWGLGDTQPFLDLGGL